MKKITNIIGKSRWIMALTISLAACSMAVANTAKTSMREMTSLEITADMEIGWNLGNTLDAHGSGVSGLATETSWNNPKTTKAMIDEVRGRGFKTIRIPVTWNSHVGAAPAYTIDADWMERVETVVNYAFQNNMYVILNTHHEDWLVPTDAALDAGRTKLVALWNQIATRFKDYGDYLIFETLNEPRVIGSPEEWSGGTDEGRNVVNQLNLAAVNAIRATDGNNALRHIMIPGYAASSASVVINALVIPNDDSRIIVSCHNYAPYSFCMQQPGTMNWGTAADKKFLNTELDRIKNKFVAAGRAVVMGEWGSKDKNNAVARAAHAAYYAQAMKDRGITPVIWDDGGIYELFTRETLTWKYPQVADAMVAP